MGIPKDKYEFDLIGYHIPTKKDVCVYTLTCLKKVTKKKRSYEKGTFTGDYIFRIEKREIGDTDES